MSKIYRVLSIIFAGYLIVLTVGILVNDHYCSGNFITTTIGIVTEDACEIPMCENDCHDETVVYSLNEPFSKPSIFIKNNISQSIQPCSLIECTKLIPQIINNDVVKLFNILRSESKIFVKIQSFLL